MHIPDSCQIIWRNWNMSPWSNMIHSWTAHCTWLTSITLYWRGVVDLDSLLDPGGAGRAGLASCWPGLVPQHRLGTRWPRAPTGAVPSRRHGGIWWTRNVAGSSETSIHSHGFELRTNNFEATTPWMKENTTPAWCAIPQGVLCISYVELEEVDVQDAYYHLVDTGSYWSLTNKYQASKLIDKSTWQVKWAECWFSNFCLLKMLNQI